MQADLFRGRRIGIIQLLIIVLCVLPLIYQASRGGTALRDNQYLSVAHDLVATKTFTDGTHDGAASAIAHPARSIAPGYPAIVATLAVFDPAIRTGLVCVKERSSACPNARPFRTLVIAQAILALLTLWLAYRLFLTLSGSEPIAWFALFLFGFSAHQSTYVPLAATFVPVMFCATGSAWLVAESIVHKSRWTLVPAGLLMGIATLFEPLYLPATLLAAPLLFVALKKHSLATAVAGTAMFATGLFLTLLPWLVRNAILFGDPWLTDGEMYIYPLAVRVAHNSIPLRDWWPALAQWTPFLGAELFDRIMPSTTTATFNQNDPTSAIAVTVQTIIAGQTVADAAPVTKLNHIISTAFPPDNMMRGLLHHTATSLALFYRGIWGNSGFVGLAAIILLWPFLRIHLWSGQAMTVAATFAPFICLAILQAVISPNFGYQNVAMPLAFAYISAYVAGSI